MFSLIISIIAIALVAALALASIYYGGSAFQKGSAEAEASTIINQGQQIQGAVALSQIDEDQGADLDALVSNKFLKEVPSSWASTNTAGVSGVLDSGDVITLDVRSSAVCLAVEDKAGRDAAVHITAQDNSTAFGCFADVSDPATAATFTAYYKL